MYNEELDRMVYWVRHEKATDSAGVDLGDIKSEAPDTVEYSEVDYPYLRLSLMRLSYEIGMLELVEDE